MKVMVDIPHEAIIRAAEEVAKKGGVCKVLPCARFIIDDAGRCYYFGLVCDARMFGEQTGVGAEYCKNCVAKETKNESRSL